MSEQEVSPRNKLTPDQFLSLWQTSDRSKLEEAGIKLDRNYNDEHVWIFEDILVEGQIIVPKGKKLGHLSISKNSTIESIVSEEGSTTGDIRVLGNPKAV